MGAKPACLDLEEVTYHICKARTRYRENRSPLNPQAFKLSKELLPWLHFALVCCYRDLTASFTGVARRVPRWQQLSRKQTDFQGFRDIDASYPLYQNEDMVQGLQKFSMYNNTEYVRYESLTTSFHRGSAVKYYH